MNTDNSKVIVSNQCNCSSKRKAKLSICALAFSVGLTNGIGMMVLALVGMMHLGGDALITIISSLYPGFAPTGIGSVFGLGWGFLDGFIFGMLVAIFYNCCLCCCKCCKCCNSEKCCNRK